MSLCDHCYAPGYCCRRFTLGGIDQYFEHPLQMLAKLATIWHGNADGSGVVGLPFMPLWRRPDGWWEFWCPNLTHEGRCGDYQNRPPVCSSFEAGYDAPCIHADHRTEGCEEAITQWSRGDPILDVDEPLWLATPGEICEAETHSKLVGSAAAD